MEAAFNGLSAGLGGGLSKKEVGAQGSGRSLPPPQPDYTPTPGLFGCKTVCCPQTFQAL